MADIVVKAVLGAGARVPAYQTRGSAGCDVHSNEDACVWARGRRLVSTGLTLEIPLGYECQIRPRSSLALKHGVIVFNTPSTIDSDYRGELFVLLVNASDDHFEVKKGDRIAQLVFAPVTRATFVEAKAVELTETPRGAGGWGSTGR